MARAQPDSRPDRSEAAIRRVREAEAKARSRVAAARREARHRIEQAQERARNIEARADQRIRRIHTVMERRLLAALEALHDPQEGAADPGIGSPRSRRKAVLAVARHLVGLDGSRRCR